MMMREETEYDEIMTCIHDYDNRCHTTYVTVYQPHQEEDCDEKFRKECEIKFEDQAVSEMVEECRSSFVPDCNVKGPEECRTVFDTECTTRRVSVCIWFYMVRFNSVQVLGKRFSVKCN